MIMIENKVWLQIHLQIILDKSATLLCSPGKILVTHGNSRELQLRMMLDIYINADRCVDKGLDAEADIKDHPDKHTD